MKSMVAQWVIFLTGSILLGIISRKSLHNFRSHGFYRFLAWECILGLLVVNAKYWLYKPLVWNQIIAWFSLTISLVPLILGIDTLKKYGNPSDQRDGDPSLMGFEKSTTLVTRGIFKYIRHPLYSSLLLLAWGIFFKSIAWTPFLLVIFATLFLFATAKADERECIEFFGIDYQEYMKQTKMFIPFVL